MTRCKFQFVERRGEKYLHRCGKCGLEVTSRKREATMKASCKAVPSSPVVRLAEPPPPCGPGTELREIFSAAGGHMPGCQCGARAVIMNKWGIDGCRENRETILGWLRESYVKTTVTEKMTAAWALFKSGVPLSLTDPLGSILDEAIHRAEAKEDERFHFAAFLPKTTPRKLVVTLDGTDILLYQWPPCGDNCEWRSDEQHRTVLRLTTTGRLELWSPSTGEFSGDIGGGPWCGRLLDWQCHATDGSSFRLRKP